MHHLKVFAASAGWVLTLTLAAFSAREGDVYLFAWALLLAFMACVPTYWLMFDDHRRRMTQAVAEIVARERRHTDDRFEAEREHTDAVIVAVAQEFAQVELPRIRRRQA